MDRALPRSLQNSIAQCFSPRPSSGVQWTDWDFLAICTTVCTNESAQQICRWHVWWQSISVNEWVYMIIYKESMHRFIPFGQVVSRLEIHLLSLIFRRTVSLFHTLQSPSPEGHQMCALGCWNATKQLSQSVCHVLGGMAMGTVDKPSHTSQTLTLRERVWSNLHELLVQLVGLSACISAKWVESHISCTSSLCGFDQTFSGSVRVWLARLGQTTRA